MICFNIKKSGSEYTGILRYGYLDKCYNNYLKKLYFEFFARWGAKEVIAENVIV